jgi:hypothetical protein
MPTNIDEKMKFHNDGRFHRDVLRRICDHPAAKLHELLPWHWKQSEPQAAAA